MIPNSVKVDKSSNRVDALEGLRGYLALWVLVCHVFWASGIGAEGLHGFARLLRQGELAVDVFIIVSGFAIFLCLDTQRESYGQFIARRFWRIFPAFIIIFAAAIPLSLLSMWNVNHAYQYLTPGEVQEASSNIRGWWDNLIWHVPLHLTMLHGLIPETLMANSPGAFLIPAWSISLEWQFYLVAPFAYALATSGKPLSRVLLAGIIGYMMWAARHVLPAVNFGAALPYHIGFFVVGAASYFAFANRAAYTRSNVWLPAAFVVSLLLYVLFRVSFYQDLVPIALWIAFLGLIVEPATSVSSRLVLPLFTNPVSQYIGRISYSLYLSHILVIDLVQYMLLAWAPGLSRAAHFSTLLVATFGLTVLLSSLLYRFVEKPGIAMGRSMARWLAARNTEGPQPQPQQA